MVYTVKAIIDNEGNVRLLEKLPVTGEKQAYVLIIESESDTADHEAVWLSEKALAEDWLRPEEDQAWSFLQSAQ